MAYLYGITDERHVRCETIRNKHKNLDTYKFKLKPFLEGRSKTKQSETSIRFRASPDTLVELCASVLDGMPLPEQFQWSCQDVADWMKELGFPQYQNTFKRNYINGKSLLRIDASYLVKMNIKDFEHIQAIANSIRILYGFERSSFSKSISLPDRSPQSLYKFFRTRTGHKYENTRFSDLCKSRHVIRSHAFYETHWQALERYLKHRKPTEKELVGGTTRKTYYQYYPPKANSPQSVQKKIYHDGDCMPPCMYDWRKQKNLREPWKLKCLMSMDNSVKDLNKCTCMQEQCSCELNKIQDLKAITVLKVLVPHRYAVNDMDVPNDRAVKIRFSLN